MKGIRTRLGGLFSRSESDAPTQPHPQQEAPSASVSAQASSAGVPTASVAGIVDDLRGYIESKGRGRWSADEVDADINLWDAGYVDSLSYVEFLVYIEAQYGVSIPDVELTDRLSTLEALATFVAANAKKGANGPRP
jgi:acyl carrier protein